jgi:hypothetical protein
VRGVGSWRRRFSTRASQLTADCRELGVDLTAHKKPDPPADDCQADPMACQH